MAGSDAGLNSPTEACRARVVPELNTVHFDDFRIFCGCRPRGRRYTRSLVRADSSATVYRRIRYVNCRPTSMCESGHLGTCREPDAVSFLHVRDQLVQHRRPNARPEMFGCMHSWNIRG